MVDRFAQIEPRVLLAVGGYGYRDRYVDRRAEVAAIRAAPADLEHVVCVPYGDAPDARTRSAGSELIAESAPLEFEPVAFDHPLYVLFSSGTTGLPKAIVHGHGGQLIEHHKNQGLGWDLKPGGRLQWFSTTAWMMWNALVSALLLRSSIVMLDGDPAWPDLLEQWRLAESYRPTVMGVAPAVPDGVPQGRAAAGPRLRPELAPRAVHGRLAAARRGLPLRLRAARPRRGPDQRLRRHRRLHRDRVGLASPSPCTRARSRAAASGVDAHAFDADGNEVVGELGELVITQPMPSMPVALWGDDDGERYRASYFDLLPGRVAPGRLDHVHRARQLRASPAARTRR